MSAARPVRPECSTLWDAVLVWGSQRQHLFDSDVDCFTHCDLHARNIMVDVVDGVAELTALLDFEGSRLSRAETEVVPMRRELVGGELEPLLGFVDEAYPELTGHPRHLDRRAVREVMEMLFRVHHWSAGDGLDPVSRIAELVGSGQHG